MPCKVEYACISYLPLRQAPVEIFRDEKPCLVDTRLSNALRALRKPDTKTYVWADGLLSEPDTPALRNIAVAQREMAWKHAHEVFVWLGSGNGHTGSALQFLEALGVRWAAITTALNVPPSIMYTSQQQVQGVQLQVRSDLGRGGIPHMNRRDAGFISALNALISVPYFNSTWAIPDIILAKKTTMLTRHGSISWDNYAYSLWFGFTSRAMLAGEWNHETLTLVQNIRTSARRHRDDQHGIELLPMVQQGMRTDCEDPRDRVFAMLPLVSPSASVLRRKAQAPAPLKVDYNISLAQLLIDTACHITEERQDLLLWMSTRSPCAANRLSGLPSRVPDWSDTTKFSPLLLRPGPEWQMLRQWADKASFFGANKKPITIDSGALHVQAHTLGRIIHVSPMFTAENCRALAWSQLQKLPKISTRQSCGTAYWRTLILDQYGMQAPAPKILGESFMGLYIQQMILEHLGGITITQLATDRLLQIRAEIDPGLKALCNLAGRRDDALYESMLMEHAVGRRFFVTNAGFLGMSAYEGEDAVDGTRSGDEVFLLRGAYFPYVMRKADEERCYQMIGEAHVQGVMRGEKLRSNRTWEPALITDIKIV